MHCFSSRVTSWLTWTLRVGGFVLRRRIGASVIRPSHLGWPTQHQRRAQEAVAVLGSQTIPWDRHRQIERKFCTIVGGVVTPVRENIHVTVGQTLPTTVTQLVDCPPTLVSLITGVRDCKVVLVGNRYYIVEGSSRRVVTTIEQ